MAHGPAKVYKMAFWDPSLTERGITRPGTWAGCPNFIDTRYLFTTHLHQGLIEHVFITNLQKNGLSIQRPWTVKDFRTDERTNPKYLVEVDIEHINGREIETVRAKYLLGGKGLWSFVREQLKVGIKHKDLIVYVWEVMDGVAKTDFPDIKVSSKILIYILSPCRSNRALRDEMYYSFRAQLNNGHSVRKQPCLIIYPNCLLDR
jgi:hypothetical protein